MEAHENSGDENPVSEQGKATKNAAEPHLQIMAHVAAEVQGVIMARNKAGEICLRLWPT